MPGNYLLIDVFTVNRGHYERQMKERKKNPAQRTRGWLVRWRLQSTYCVFSFTFSSNSARTVTVQAVSCRVVMCLAVRLTVSLAKIPVTLSADMKLNQLVIGAHR